VRTFSSIEKIDAVRLHARDGSLDDKLIGPLDNIQRDIPVFRIDRGRKGGAHWLEKVSASIS
jgi:hypothetical protein